MNTLRNVILTGAVALMATSSGLLADDHVHGGHHREKAKNNIKIIKLPNATQAPFWPPAEVVDKDGNFVVVGNVLRRSDNGSVRFETGAALVSANTTPPVDADGVEDFSNPLGAPYEIIRELDLSPHSSDRDIELFTVSYGPPRGLFGGGGRIPMEGKSAYNLNSLPDSCPDLFPGKSQEYGYKRRSFPLGRASVAGFQGDQVAYDSDTGLPYDPMLASGEGCGAGCTGENRVDFYPGDGRITLGEWIDGVATVKIRLKDWDEDSQAYTSASFHVSLKNAIPNALYTVWLPRTNVAVNQGQPEYRQPPPAGLPNIIITDEEGYGDLSFDVENPFPAPEVDDQQLRVVGMAVDFHSDYQNWGACFSRLGAGVDIHAQWISFADGTFDFTDFVTVPKRSRHP